jgi:hypothetical protein
MLLGSSAVNADPGSLPTQSAPTPSPETCPNCGAIRVGPFCAGCGQSLREPRVSFGLLWRWLVGQVLSFDRGFLLTVREMTLRPGTMIRDYLAGQRQRYTNPFTYLLLWSAASLLVWSLLGDHFMAQMRDSIAAGFRRSPLTPAQLKRYLDVFMLVIPYAGQVTMLVCLPFAALLRLLFRRSGYNFAEHFVFALFGMGHAFAWAVPLELIVFPLHASYRVTAGVTYLTYAVYIQAAPAFYGRWSAVFKVFLSLILAFATLSLAQPVLIIYAILTTR